MKKMAKKAAKEIYAYFQAEDSSQVFADGRFSKPR